MSRRRRRAALPASGATLLALVLVACGELLSLSNDDPRADADGSTGSDAAGVDGGGTAEGSTGVDGAVDASVGDASLDARWCATRDAQRCYDFDDSTPVETGWGTPFLGQGGMLAKDSLFSTSPPNAMVARLPSMGQPFAQNYTGALTWASGVFAVELELRIDETPDSGLAQVVEIAQGEYRVLLYARADATADFLQEYYVTGMSDVSSATTSKLVKNVWRHVRVAITPGAGKTAKLFYDRAAAPSAAVDLQGPWAPGEISVGVGIGYVEQPAVSGGELWRFRYDNVLIGAP